MSFCGKGSPASAESKMAVAQSEASARVGVGLSIILTRDKEIKEQAGGGKRRM
jgi:hypothetical protein